MKALFWRLVDTVNFMVPRCECGWRIWPWQEAAFDPDLCADIHLACGSTEWLGRP